MFDQRGMTDKKPEIERKINSIEQMAQQMRFGVLLRAVDELNSKKSRPDIRPAR